MRTAMAQGARRAMIEVFGQLETDATIAGLRAAVRMDRITRAEEAMADTVDAMPPSAPPEPSYWPPVICAYCGADLAGCLDAWISGGVLFCNVDHAKASGAAPFEGAR